MELTFVLTSIIQSVAISLGVGCSTLAIINFFAAIADGKIDETERRMMGVVYTVLRVAMILILITSLILGTISYLSVGTAVFTNFVFSLWTLIAVLYINALLMTLRVVPSTIGPALQASAWYTLGILVALVPHGLVTFSYWQFILGFACVFTLAVSIVNGLMVYLKNKRSEAAGVSH